MTEVKPGAASHQEIGDRLRGLRRRFDELRGRL